MYGMPGTAGSRGGTGGARGMGGFAGSHEISSGLSGKHWPVSVIDAVEGKAGKDGAHGSHGKDGTPGSDRIDWGGIFDTTPFKLVRTNTALEDVVYIQRYERALEQLFTRVPLSDAVVKTEHPPQTRAARRDATACATLLQATVTAEFAETSALLQLRDGTAAAAAEAHKRQAEQSETVTLSRLLDAPATTEEATELECRDDVSGIHLKEAAMPSYYESELLRADVTTDIRHSILQLIRSHPSEAEVAALVRLLSSGEVDVSRITPGSSVCDLLSVSNEPRSAAEIAQLAIGPRGESAELRSERRARLERVARGIRVGAVASRGRDKDETLNFRLLTRFEEALAVTHGGIRLRDTQRMAVLIALESETNLLQQVATGEGKSFIIAAIAAIRCLRDPSITVDVITSSSVLAERDVKALHSLYEKLELTVAHNCAEDREMRSAAYKARVVYGDISAFQRDHLLHHFYGLTLLGAREERVAIVDEVDSMMLDNGNHVLYLSHNVVSMKLLHDLFVHIHRAVVSSSESSDTRVLRERLLRDMFGSVSIDDIKSFCSDSDIDENFETLKSLKVLDDERFLLVQSAKELRSRLMGAEDQLLIDLICLEMDRPRELSLPVHLMPFVRRHITTFIENCKRAQTMRINVDYVVDFDVNGGHEYVVTIVDGDTGVDLPSTQWSGGLHQFLQLKHACRLTPLTLKAVFVSNVAYLKRYKRINGLSGTLGSVEESRTLVGLYKAELAVLPTNTPRRFYELAPIFVHQEAEFIAALYATISKQLDSGRSVLVICPSIDQLRKIHAAIAKLPEASDRIEQAVVYERSHEQLKYEQTTLEGGRLILSTNLAGRGTDIRLSDELVAAGGLHVLLTFLPRNRRVEEQAFGRAARAGAPGSGQIVALRRRSDVKMPTAEVKRRRDEAEIKRIQALKLNFEYRVAVEEACLARYLERCPFRADGGGGGPAAAARRFPVADEVLRAALLDEWTLWLDGAGEAIEACALEQDEAAKESIVASVEEFVRTHEIVRVQKGKGLPIVPDWLRASEWLLRLALIKASHKNGEAEARDMLNEIIDRERGEGEFAAFAYYYLGCMAMRGGWAGVRPERVASLAPSADLAGATAPPEVPAGALFARARTLLELQQARSDARFRGVLQAPPAANAAVDAGERCGLRRQAAEASAAYQRLIDGIDWLIGTPMEAADALHALVSNEKRAASLFDHLKLIGLFTPPRLPAGAADSLSAFQAREVRRTAEIVPSRLEAMLRALAADAGKDGGARIVLASGADLERAIALPARGHFWKEMIRCDVFRDVRPVLVISRARMGVLEAFGVAPLPIDPLAIRYSEKPLIDCALYPTHLNLNETTTDKQRSAFDAAVRALTAAGDLEADVVARMGEADGFPRLPAFDGFSKQQLQLACGEAAARWTLERLTAASLIQEVQPEPRYRLSVDWAAYVSIRLAVRIQRAFDKHADGDSIDEPSLQEAMPKMKPKEGEDAPRSWREELLELGVIEATAAPAYYRLRGGLAACADALPPALAPAVHRFLAHRTAYTYSMRALAAARVDALKRVPRGEPGAEVIGGAAVIKQTLLPEDPYGELYAQLRRVGIIERPTLVERAADRVDYLDLEDVVDRDALVNFIHARRYKLDDAVRLFKLEPFGAILEEEGAVIGMEMAALIALGMPAALTLKKPTVTQKVVGNVVRFVSGVFKHVFSAAIFAIGIVGFVIGAVLAKMGAVANASTKAASSVAPEWMKNRARDVSWGASFTVDAAALLTNGLKGAFSWIVAKLMRAVQVARENSESVEWAASKVRDAFTDLREKCTALFGSAEYYQQCRMATGRAAERAGLTSRVDEFRMLRVYHQIDMMGDEQAGVTEAKEQHLMDRMERRAGALKRAIETKIDKQIRLTKSTEMTIEAPRHIIDKKFVGLKTIACCNAELSAALWVESRRYRYVLALAAEGEEEAAAEAESAQLGATVCRSLADLVKELSTANAVDRAGALRTLEYADDDDEDAAADENNVTARGYLVVQIDEQLRDNFIKPLTEMIRNCCIPEPRSR